MNDIVTVEEAARFLRRHPGTIRRWIEKKKLKARHLSAGGHGIFAILRNDLLELAVNLELDDKSRQHEQPHVVVDKNQRRLPL